MVQKQPNARTLEKGGILQEQLPPKLNELGLAAHCMTTCHAAECQLKAKGKEKERTGTAQSVPEPQALRDGNHDSLPLGAASWGSHTSYSDNDRHKKCAMHSMKVRASIAHVAQPIATDDRHRPATWTGYRLEQPMVYITI